MFKKLTKDFLNRKLRNYRFIENINKNYIKDQKTILFIYLNNNYYIDKSKNVAHTNIFEAQQMINVLTELDFCIDVVNCMDNMAKEILKNKKYDYILGIGNLFYEACKSNKEAIKILYVTENPPWISYEKEKERIDYYYFRKNKKVHISRSGVFYKDNHFENIDFCITLGEEYYYKDFPFKTYRLHPTYLENKEYKISNRGNANKNFLWFGSNGAVHKGLDLLIDIFTERNDLNLFICGLTDKDRKILRINSENIFDIGKIDVQQKEFINICDKCDFMIFPSCSEATSTAVLTAMRHGLIPIVSKGIGFDKFIDHCILLDDYKIEYINSVIDECLTLDYDYIFSRRMAIQKFTINKFKLEEFTNNFKKIMIEICD
ncbi:glycosyltransferase [Gottfriedia acidiceleris]|uniref:glycosyltransferase n=1 Tax=Gottfriedia acidiceleris TaxID=371036 RepID=UPI000B433F96|nr:glycosyltransferase [Gottfriedia acidiceleris]